MKKIPTFLVLLMSLPFALAGEGKCKGTTQECLDMMADQVNKRGWVGIQIEPSDLGIKIQSVMENSPALASGLQAEDVLLGINGLLYKDKSPALEEVYKNANPGSTITYSVQRGDQTLEIKVVLGTWPDELKHKYIGRHMLEYHAKKANS